jgi:peptidoglycan/LPS O-acetylase OafA/YrhL
MLLFALFGVLVIFAVTKAEGKWKVLNVLIVIGGCALGFGVGYLAGVWAQNMALGGELAVPISLAFGALAAVFAPRKKTDKPQPTPPTQPVS